MRDQIIQIQEVIFSFFKATLSSLLSNGPLVVMNEITARFLASDNKNKYALFWELRIHSQINMYAFPHGRPRKGVAIGHLANGPYAKNPKKHP